MALQGNLRDFSLTEILQLLGTQKKTGCLMLEWNTERAQVYIADGRLVATREPGMSPSDPLLTFLVRTHRLSDEQRRGLTSIHRESGRDLEDLLVNGRYLDAEELKGFIERQILNDLMTLVRWENGAYRFDPKKRWPDTPLVRLSMEGALIEAARRVDEQRRYVLQFNDPYKLLGVRDLPDPDEPLSEEEKELFGIIDGHHTVAEVVDSAPLSEYEAYEALHRMLEAQWIEVVGRRAPGAAETPAETVEQRPPLRISVPHEVLVGCLVLAAAATLPWVTRSWRTPVMESAATDVFAIQRIEVVRDVLDLYRREHGHYPERLSELVDDDWVRPDQLELPGERMHYRVLDRGTRYQLDFQGR
ncbi:MAG: DUF4388 domain-containing protein [Candidatus Eisenbacteria bacterium]